MGLCDRAACGELEDELLREKTGHDELRLRVKRTLELMVNEAESQTSEPDEEREDTGVAERLWRYAELLTAALGAP